jgi:hypothetical protein
MQLIERYLQAVKFWLPNEHKQDIVAELSEDLYSQIEEKEAEVGRKLNDNEVEAILKQRGRPVLVANRFLRQEYLIGPVMFPIYIFVLKIVALCYLLPWALVWVGIMTYSPTYRAEHNGWLGGMGTAWASLWSITFIAIGLVTVVFAVLEQVQHRSHFLENWNPRKLPPVRNTNRIKRSSSIGEIVGNVALIGWVSYLSSPLLVNRPEIQVLLSPVWRYFFWAYLCVALANTALSIANFRHPYWTVKRASIRLFSDCIGSTLFCWLMKINIVAAITVPKIAASRTAQITNSVNQSMANTFFPLAVLLGVAILCGDLYRIYRVRKTPISVIQSAAAVVF